MQVARSNGASPDSGFGAFQLLRIDGYEAAGSGNIYMGAVKPCPYAADMLLGLFAVNLGDARRDLELRGNSDGESFIGLSLSCDGVHWSQMQRISNSTGHGGRTADHPVDGFLKEGSMVSVLIHKDVYGIAPREDWQRSRLVRRTLNRGPLMQLAAAVRRKLVSSCSPTTPRTPKYLEHAHRPLTELNMNTASPTSYSSVWTQT